MKTIIAAQICDTQINPVFLCAAEATHHKESPPNVKLKAVSGDIFGQPGKILLRSEISKHQPVKTTTPAINTQTPAVLATAFGHCENVVFMQLQVCRRTCR